MDKTKPVVKAYLDQFRQKRPELKAHPAAKGHDTPQINKTVASVPRSTGARKPAFGARSAKLTKPKANIEGLPNEILLEIFYFLSPNDVLTCSSVSKRWHSLSQDNLLWQHIYKCYVQRRTDATLRDGESWKTLCMQRCEKSRNSRLRPLMKKIDNFTGLLATTEKILRKAGLGFSIVLTDYNSCEHLVREKDLFFFRMAVCARWYDTSLPPANKIKKIQVFAMNPLFFDMKGDAIANSPAKKSLLFEGEFKSSDWLKDPINTTEMIDLYVAPFGFLVALWKDTKDIAFMSLNLHSHNLVKRCLFGTIHKVWNAPAPNVLRDDLDRKYGLHGYTCTMELRNMRTSFWNQQFRNLYMKDGDASGGLARLVLLDPENDYDRSSVAQKIAFLWKTDAFKGRVENMCFVDLTLLDEHTNPMWCISAPVNLSQPNHTQVNYNFSGNRFLLHHENSSGKFVSQLIWEQEEKQYYMVGLEVFLNLSFVNQWFGTAY